ncbi:MAG: hypothetical protein ABW087_01340 [Candidatus Thiodiazotropha sp.]
MRLHRICGVRFRSHLRSYARAYAYRGLTAFASLSMAVSVRINDAAIVFFMFAAQQNIDAIDELENHIGVSGGSRWRLAYGVDIPPTSGILFQYLPQDIQLMPSEG